MFRGCRLFVRSILRSGPRGAAHRSRHLARRSRLVAGSGLAPDRAYGRRGGDPPTGRGEQLLAQRWPGSKLLWVHRGQQASWARTCYEAEGRLFSTGGPLTYGLVPHESEWFWSLALGINNYQRVCIDIEKVIARASRASLSQDGFARPARMPYSRRGSRFASCPRSLMRSTGSHEVSTNSRTPTCSVTSSRALQPNRRLRPRRRFPPDSTTGQRPRHVKRPAAPPYVRWRPRGRIRLIA